MEGVLKGLEGKTLTKKKLFDFLADIDIDILCGKKSLDTKLLNTTIESNPNKKKSEIKCAACSREFTVENSRRRHYIRYPACVKWIEQNPQKIVEEEKKVEGETLKKGLHLLIVDFLEKSVSSEDTKLKCRWCETTFTNTGNINKHLNTAKMCNKMAFEEFKKHINSV
jgi:DNA-directed RNA polymerase subunit RPC12/RpoP